MMYYIYIYQLPNNIKDKWHILRYVKWGLSISYQLYAAYEDRDEKVYNVPRKSFKKGMHIHKIKEYKENEEYEKYVFSHAIYFLEKLSLKIKNISLEFGSFWENYF